jgi:hypothetical protein
MTAVRMDRGDQLSQMVTPPPKKKKRQALRLRGTPATAPATSGSARTGPPQGLRVGKGQG